MKRTVCIVYMVCLVAMASFAQGLVQDGKIKVDRVSVARNEGSLFLTMEVDVSNLQVKSEEEVILVPKLVSGEDRVAAFSPVCLAGHNRYYRHLRNRAKDLRDGEDGFYRASRVRTLQYKGVISYAAWMDEAELRLDEDRCGCCSELLLDASELLTRLDFGPKEFQPQFVWRIPQVEAVKERELKGSAFIDFPVNRVEIYPEYRKNPEELAKIRATIETVRNDADTRITAISIKGYASPEGSYANNTRLAEGRTLALKEYVRSLYRFEDKVFGTSFEPEDWEGLRRFVETTGWNERENMLKLINGSEEPDRKDAMLKRTWPQRYAYLLENVYPALRHSDYVVKYVVRAYTDVEEAKRILKTAPGKLSLQELYRVAESYGQGTPEYNETVETMVHLYPEDATANLNAANVAMSRRDFVSARRYLDKAGTDGQADYARGVCAAMQGEYTTARPYLEKAKENGVSEAAEALRQLQRLERTDGMNMK